MIAVAAPRYHLIKKCDLKKAIVLIRNPYKVLLAEFNKKTGWKPFKTLIKARLKSNYFFSWENKGNTTRKIRSSWMATVS